MSQQKILSNAFIAMLKADPAATTKAATLLKRVSGEAPAAEPAQAVAAPKAAEPTPTPTAAAPAAGGSSPAAAQAKPNPITVAAQTRTGKQAVAAKAAQSQMAANPAAAKTAPQTPDQIRAGKQAAAGTTARAQMAANPAAPKPPAPQTPDQIRAAKQAAAGKTAQDQMAANPAAPKASATTSTPTSPAAEPGAAAFGNMASQLSKGNDANYQATLDKNVAAEKEKLAAMQQKNPKLAGMMAQAGMDADGNDISAGRAQGGGKVKGQLSDNPSAVKRREARQIKADQERMATGTESVDYSIRESRNIFTK